jgi:aminopeptidase N
MKKTLVFLAVGLLTCTAFAQRLPGGASPEHYTLTVDVNFPTNSFDGDETIKVNLDKPTNTITLNALEITFHNVSVTAGGQTQTAKVELDEKNEMATFTVDKQLPAGEASIHIKYTGQLNDKLRGFYLSTYKGKKYLVSQMESTDARVAFPSFDEPSYKATFDLTAIIDKGDVAISNGEVISDTPGPGNKHTVKFSTSPKMSSYLVALTVGDWKCISDHTDGVKVSVCTVPGKENMAQFPLEASKNFLHYYDNYYGIKYPLPKLDNIAVPDFQAGAMENWGAIIYRETALLIDEKTASVGAKQNVADTIAHEMAHQWFGDLVTMKWWDDIWLNEGFATWMSSKPIEAWKPEWNFNLDDANQAGNTMNVDSLANTRPIHQAAETPAEIQELFDGIAYGKAAAVLSMLEAYLGEDTFRAGVNAYLSQHQYANATADDFWGAQAKTSKKPVDRIMPTFVKQPGVPILDVKAQCSGDTTKVTLHQQRYFSDRAKFDSPNDQVWEIPVCLKGSAGASAQKCEVISKREETVSLPGCSTWVLANANATGYYRVGYQPEMVKALASDAETKLTPAERISLQNDIWASVRVGREPVGDYLAFAQGIQADRNRAVLEATMGRLNYIGQYLVNDSDRGSFRAWLRQLFTPAFAELGWEPKPGETDEQKTLRQRLLNTLGYDARDPQVLAEARKIADKFINDPRSVDRQLAGGAFGLAALNGDAAFYDRIMAELKNAKAPEEYYGYLFTLAEFSDPKLLQRTLDFAVSPDVRSQDALRLISNVMHNPAGEKLAWDFIQSHWDAVAKAGGPFASGEVVGATSAFCDTGMRDQVTDFFAAHKIAAAERTFRQSIERINNCVDLKSRQEPQLSSWLGQHGTAGAN